MRIRGCATSKKYFIVQSEDSLFSDDFGKTEVMMTSDQASVQARLCGTELLLYPPG
jgi:hypothetical protein